jgi:uncharacterized coiled-coil protein SlyX
MDVLTLAINLYERAMKQINKTESIEQQNVGKVKSEIRDLKNELIENKEIAQQIIKNIKKSKEMNPEEGGTLEEKIREQREKIRELEEKIRELEQKLERLEGENKNLRDKVAEHDIRFASLETGQIAFDFEKDVAKYIYPDGKKFGSRQIFTNMKKWLEKKNGTPQGDEAWTRWNDLQREFSWSDEHERVFLKLLKHRRIIAHPVVDRKEVQSRFPDDFNDQERQRIQDIIAMTERVNELME